MLFETVEALQEAVDVLKFRTEGVEVWAVHHDFSPIDDAVRASVPQV